MIEKIYSLKISKKANIVLIDLILSEFLMEYKGNLVKYLFETKYDSKFNQLKKSSKFLNDNSYVKNLDRRLMIREELTLLKFTRLIDTNIQLFCQIFSWLSDQVYTNVILNYNQEGLNKNSVYDLRFIHKFLALNEIDSE